MSPVCTLPTTIRTPAPPANQPPNPLDTAIHRAGQRLASLQMTRLVREPTKGDAQNIVRDALDVARIIDAALLEIGRELRAHFGSHIDLTLWTDQLSGALEGNATFNVCEAIEVREEDFEAEIGDWNYKNHRDYAA